MFFIDAGRRRVSFEDRWVTSPPVFDVYRPGLDDRQLAICHAASPGQRAYGVLGGVSLFVAGLIRALQGEAATPYRGKKPRGAAPIWQVTLGSLVQTLPRIMENLTRGLLPSEQRILINCRRSGDVVLVRLEDAPLVPVSAEFEPPELAEQAEIEIRLADDTIVDVQSPVRAPGRRELVLPAGPYVIRVSFNTGDTSVEKPGADIRFISIVEPPDTVWRIDTING